MIFIKCTRYIALILSGLAFVTTLPRNVIPPEMNYGILKHRQLKAKKYSTERIAQTIILVGQEILRRIFRSTNIPNYYSNINWNSTQILCTTRNDNTDLLDDNNSNEEKEYDVLYIIDHEDRHNGRHYLVRWKGFPRLKDCTYEPKSSLNKKASIILSEYENFLLENEELISNKFLIPNTQLFRRRAREYQKPGQACRNNCYDFIDRPITQNNFIGNRLIVENYFEFLSKNGYYSNDSAIKLRPWLINGKSYDFDMKSQLEVILWRTVFYKLKSEKYFLSSHLIGCNNVYKCVKRGQEDLENELSDTFPDIKNFFYKSHSATKKYLWENFLKLIIYEKPILCLLSFPIGPYGSPFHTSVALISRINDYWDLKYFDSWPKEEKNKRNFVTGVLEECYPVFKSNNTSRQSTFGRKSDMSCYRSAINTIADLLDEKPVSAFEWFDVIPK